MSKTIQEQIEVMTHFANSGEVEFMLLQGNKEEWRLKTNPTMGFDWSTKDYRIKEQKKTVTIEKWLLKIKDKELYWEYSTNDIHKYILCQVGAEKVKLLETYEVKL